MLRPLFPRLLLIGSLALALAGCETPIALPVGEQAPELGVISEFTQAQTLEVRVFEGNFLFGEEDTRYLEYATVAIFRGDSLLETLVYDQTLSPPAYISRFLQPVPGVEYRIEVEAEGFEPVSASSRVPANIPIDRVEVSDLRIERGEENPLRQVTYTVGVQFQDPPEEANFYLINFRQEVWTKMVEGDFVPHGPDLRRVNFGPVDDLGPFVAFSPGGLLFRDESFAGLPFDRAFDLRFELADGEELGKLYVELRAVSEEYYLFQTSLALQTSNPGQPLDDGASIFNNIVNGRGIFAGYNATEATVELPR